MNRIYLDHNATTPLDSDVAEFLGDVQSWSFANPSSQHSSGKRALRELRASKRSILDIFGLSDDSHFVIFHSGATEAATWFFANGFQIARNQGLDACRIVSATDHSCALGTNLWEESTYCTELDEWGRAVNVPDCSGYRYLHLTWANNETGVVTQNIDSLAQESDLSYLDAAQVVGKIANWRQLPNVDIVTFSGHKFGAPKGLGLSIIKKGNAKLSGLFQGGGQQGGLRPGTMNPLGAKCLELALKSRCQVDVSEAESCRNTLESEAREVLGERVEIIGDGVERLANTTLLAIPELRGDQLLPFFDLAGIDVSLGSACNAGSLDPSHVMAALDREDIALNTIRLSLGTSTLGSSDLGRVREVFSRL